MSKVGFKPSLGVRRYVPRGTSADRSWDWTFPVGLRKQLFCHVAGRVFAAKHLFLLTFVAIWLPACHQAARLGLLCQRPLIAQFLSALAFAVQSLRLGLAGHRLRPRVAEHCKRLGLNSDNV